MTSTLDYLSTTNSEKVLHLPQSMIRKSSTFLLFCSLFVNRSRLTISGSTRQPATLLTQQNCMGVLDSKCLCNEYIINCTNARFENTDIFMAIAPTHFPKLEVLIVTGSRFEKLDNFLLGFTGNHGNLRYLDLSNNSVVHIDLKAFSNLPNLEHLILNNNQLSTEEDDERACGFFHQQTDRLRILQLENAFNKSVEPERLAKVLMYILGPLNKLNQLEYLHLMKNNITTLDSQTFCHLPALQYLYLEDNRLTSFSGSAVNETCTPSLTELHLDNNSLSRFNRFEFDSAIHLNKISFAQNPFDCFCELNEFVRWYKRNQYRMLNQNETTCFRAYPEWYTGRPLTEIEDGALRCESERISAYMHNVYVICGLSIAGLCWLLFCLFYANRRLLCVCNRESRSKSSRLMVSSRGYEILGKEPEVRAEMV